MNPALLGRGSWPSGRLWESSRLEGDPDWDWAVTTSSQVLTGVVVREGVQKMPSCIMGLG